MILKKILSITLLFGLYFGQAQVGIGTTTPDPSSALDITSTSRGLLIPRMTLTQRDDIVTPVEGLQIFNTTNKSLDLYTDGSWKSFSIPIKSNLVYVYSLADLPTPDANGAINLLSDKMYIFSGPVDISPNYIQINGAGLRGTDPQKDQVISTVSGAVLRSTNTNVYIKELAVVPYGSDSQAYNFTDDGTHFCNIFSGSSVVDGVNPADSTPVPSLGVGTISGFRAITILQNYWNTANGVKIGGTVGKFTSGYNFIVGISNGGAGIELTSGLNAQDVDLSNNYFIYNGQTGIKVDANATVDRGRLTTNMFRGNPTPTPLDGIDSYSPGWTMSQNTNIPDSRAFSYIYFNGNTTATTATAGTFVKIKGNTDVIKQQRFSAVDNTNTIPDDNNRITYDGLEVITAKIFVVISASADKNDSGFSIAVSKTDVSANTTTISNAIATASSLSNNQSFQITLNSEIDLSTGDYIEVFIRNNSANDKTITVSELQFSVTD